MLTAKKDPHEVVKELQIGDPWTLIRDEPRRDEAGEPLKPGNVLCKWFATNEPARAFEITAIHHESVYETKFVGFYDRDPETGAWSVKPSKEGLPNDCPVR